MRCSHWRCLCLRRLRQSRCLATQSCHLPLEGLLPFPCLLLLLTLRKQTDLFRRFCLRTHPSKLACPSLLLLRLLCVCQGLRLRFRLHLSLRKGTFQQICWPICFIAIDSDDRHRHRHRWWKLLRFERGRIIIINVRYATRTPMAARLICSGTAGRRNR